MEANGKINGKNLNKELDKETVILIIDDEESIRRSFVNHFEDYGYIALTAENGREGIEIMRREKPDIVLLDLRMPEVDGFEVLARACEIAPDIPIIVVSGTGEIGDAIEAIRRGACDYILKPVVELSILNHRIEAALENARLVKQNREYQENLELMVEERSKELRKANEHLTQINKRLRKIVASTRSLSVYSELKGFGSRLLEEFGQHMMASGGSLYLIEEKGLQRAHTLDAGHSPLFIPFPLAEDSLYQRAISTKQPILVHNLEKSGDLLTSGWNGYKDGSALVFPLPDESGRVTGVLSLHSKKAPPFIEQDKEIGSILASYSCETLRAVRAVEALRENERLLRATFEQAAVGVVNASLNGCFLRVNKRFCQIVGYPHDQLIGLNFNHISHPQDLDICLKPLRDMIEGKRNTFATAKQFLKQDGTDVWANLTFSLMQNDNGEPEYFIVIVEDISERIAMEEEKEKLEAQLVQAQKMEAVGTLAGGLAHDFNNVLAGIYGPVSIIQNKLNNNIPITTQRLTKHASMMRKSCERAADMVKQLLAISHKHELSFTTVDLNYSLKHVIKIVKNTFDKSVEVVPVYFNGPAITHADPTQIEQVILNLFINASHAMTTMRPNGDKWGGILEVSLEKMFADEHFLKIHPEVQPGNYWLIHVKDNGVGMDRSVIPKIFTPFFTTKKDGEGTGLGLSMVYNIVKQHGGVMNVYSEPGKGSTFNIYLPQSKEVEGMAYLENQREEIPRGEGVVLVVEDEEVLQSTVKEILEDCGYQTIIAGNGIEALEIFKERGQHIDLVLLDMGMPKMSGSDTYMELKKIDPEVNVLLASGYKENERIRALQDLGVKGFVQKPYDMERLARAVKEHIKDPAACEY